MSWLGKVFLLVSVVTFCIMFIARIYLGGWLSMLYVPLVTSVLSFILAIIVDIKYYAEVLTLRSTKHGLSLGLSVLLFIISLVSINIISVKVNKSIDLSSNQLNSISKETKAVLASIDQNILVSTYYRGKKDKVKLMQIKKDLEPYINESPLVDVNYVNIYKNSAKAKIELKDIPSENDVITILRYKDRLIQVNNPINKKNIEQAFTLVSRSEDKKVYFLLGPGLRSIHDEGFDGLLGLAQVLTTKGYQVEGLSINQLESISAEKQKLLVIAGPQINISKNSIDRLRAYINEGGQLLLAADPDSKQLVQNLASIFGLHFKNNYIISEVGEKIGRSATSSVGVVFSSESEITKEFVNDKQSYVIFENSSEVSAIKNENFELFIYTPMLATSKESFTVEELKVRLTPEKRSTKTMAVLAESKDSKQGKVLLVGDSDFLTNKDLLQGVNKQLAINITSSFLNEKDLINSKNPDKLGTKIILTDRLRNSITVAGFFIPFSLILISSLLFYRRKGA